MGYHIKTVPSLHTHFGGGVSHNIPIYRGRAFSGSGMFGSIFSRFIYPILEKSGPFIAGKLREAGGQFVSRVKSGDSLKQAVKRTASSVYNSTKQDLSKLLSGSGVKRRKLKTPKLDIFRDGDSS